MSEFLTPWGMAWRVALMFLTMTALVYGPWLLAEFIAWWSKNDE